MQTTNATLSIGLKNKLYLIIESGKRMLMFLWVVHLKERKNSSSFKQTKFLIYCSERVWETKPDGGIDFRFICFLNLPRFSSLVTFHMWRQIVRVPPISCSRIISQTLSLTKHPALQRDSNCILIHFSSTCHRLTFSHFNFFSTIIFKVNKT